MVATTVGLTVPMAAGDYQHACKRLAMAWGAGDAGRLARVVGWVETFAAGGVYATGYGLVTCDGRTLHTFRAYRPAAYEAAAAAEAFGVSCWDADWDVEPWKRDDERGGWYAEVES